MSTPQNSRLLGLPNEVLTLIANNVPRRQDLSRCARSCKLLQVISSPVLFEAVTLYLPQTRSFFEKFEGLITLPCTGLKYTKKLKIMNYWQDSYDDGEYEDDADFELYGKNYETLQDKRCRDLAAGFNFLVASILAKIPMHQLISVRWYHRFPAAGSIIDKVLKYQHQSLTELHVANSCLEWDPYQHPSQNLKSLEIWNLPDEDSVSGLRCLVNANAKTLRSLKVGYEAEAFLQYNKDGEAAWLVQGVVFDIDDQFYLETLALQDFGAVGISLFATDKTNFDKPIGFRDLQRLSLESCADSESFLECLANFYAFGNPNSTELA